MAHSARLFIRAALFALGLVLLRVGTSGAEGKQFVSKQSRPVQLRSVNYPDRYVRHKDFLGELTPLATDADKLDGSFVRRAGLAGRGISFESVNNPGYYLRHQAFRIKLQRSDGSEQFKQDATFIEKAGVAGKGKSFEAINYPGHYIRHCSFRLFLDNNQRGNQACSATEDVYKSDVSFEVVTVTATTTPTPPVTEAIRLRSVNYPDRYVRHRNFLGELTPVTSDLDRQDSSFIIRPGLAGRGVSFESVNFPGYFLRQQDFQLKLQQREDSDTFKQDATFEEKPGVGGKGKSFEAINHPGHYLRHCSFKMFIDNNQRGNGACDARLDVYKADVSFEVVRAQ